MSVSDTDRTGCASRFRVTNSPFILRRPRWAPAPKWWGGSPSLSGRRGRRKVVPSGPPRRAEIACRTSAFPRKGGAGWRFWEVGSLQDELLVLPEVGTLGRHLVTRKVTLGGRNTHFAAWQHSAPSRTTLAPTPGTAAQAEDPPPEMTLHPPSAGTIAATEPGCKSVLSPAPTASADHGSSNARWFAMIG
jgi:hypothetical protein